MGLKDILKAVSLQAGRFIPGRSYISPMLIPVGLSSNDYLKLYGEVGWVFGGVSLIAQAVAEPGWHLYSGWGKDKKEIEDHSLLDLLAFVNPFQTRFEFVEMGQMYLTLTGENFIVLNYNRAGVPAEMWIVPPSQMEVIPDANDYIKGYLYRTASRKIPLSMEQVIHMKCPSPLDPYRGMGPMQSIGVPSRSEKYAGQMTEKQFFNDAIPGTLLSSEQLPPKAQRDEIREQWIAEHQGWRNTGKTAFLWAGLKATRLSLTNTELDLSNLRHLNRDIILGVLHIPLSIMGITGETGSRARVEGDEYVFAKRVVKPCAIRFREAFNEQLCPLFDDNLSLDFDDPVPENTEAERLDLESGIKTGYLKINEARAAKGLEADPKGDVFLWEVQSASPFSISAPTRAFKKAIPVNESDKEAYWFKYVAKVEGYERDIILSLTAMFTRQLSECLTALGAGKRELFDKEKAINQYKDAVTLPLTRLIKEAKADAENLIAPEQGKLLKVEPQDQAALNWLKTRITWAAMEVGDETAKQLADTLAAGYAAGESMEKLADRVKAVFTFANETRTMRIARTETIAASNQGAIYGYKEAGVEKTQILAAYDERVCELCNSLDGQVNDIGEGFIPPFHVSCRCVVLAYFED